MHQPPAPGSSPTVHPAWGLVPQPHREHIVRALRRSADWTEEATSCDIGAHGACRPGPDHTHDLPEVQQWLELADAIQAAPTHRPSVHFDPVACRQWLEDGAAERAGIGEDFCSANDTIAAGLEDLLAELDNNPVPHMWLQQPPLSAVNLWRTTDDDAIDGRGDGGAIITITLDVTTPRLRIATLYQSGDQFANPGSRGIGAAVEALSHLAELVNRELAVLWPAPPPAADHTSSRCR